MAAGAEIAIFNFMAVTLGTYGLQVWKSVEAYGLQVWKVWEYMDYRYGRCEDVLKGVWIAAAGMKCVGMYGRPAQFFQAFPMPPTPLKLLRTAHQCDQGRLPDPNSRPLHTADGCSRGASSGAHDVGCVSGE